MAEKPSLDLSLLGILTEGLQKTYRMLMKIVFEMVGDVPAGDFAERMAKIVKYGKDDQK